MIVGQAGVIAGNVTSYIPYGTLLSQSCTYTTIEDAKLVSYSGYYNSHKTYANGTGGTYTTDIVGTDSCYYPYGFFLSYSTYSIDVSWTGCSNSGTLSSAGMYEYSQMADGAGGWIYIDAPISWNYSNGYYIYDNGTNCRVILNTSAYPWYTVENYGVLPYGTKIGTPYWGGAYLIQDIADGYGGVISNYWDGSSPYPVYGTQIASQTYACSYHGDAIGTSFYLCFYTNTYADGSNGSYTVDTIDGNYPMGWAFTAPSVITSETDSSWYVLNSLSEYVYPYRYGNTLADGTGGTYTSYSYAPYGTILSPYFNEITYGGGYIYSDVYGGYYFATSSPP